MDVSGELRRPLLRWVMLAVDGVAAVLLLAVTFPDRGAGRPDRGGGRRTDQRVALFGTVLGMVMGLGFTAAALTILSDQGFTAPVIPVQTLIAIAIGAVVAGTIAAALPARRASRRPVLEAIHNE